MNHIWARPKRVCQTDHCIYEEEKGARRGP